MFRIFFILNFDIVSNFGFRASNLLRSLLFFEPFLFSCQFLAGIESFHVSIHPAIWTRAVRQMRRLAV
jgi:hypothetical protein